MIQPSTPQIPDELRSYLDTIADRLLSGHAAVMVGAGFSKNAASPGSTSGFPDWSRLGDRFFERLSGRPPGPNEMYLQVPALAHQVEAAFGRPALDQMVRDTIPDLQHEPSPIHAALLELPWSDVFTTNHDTLLERARRSVISKRYDLVLKPDDLGHSNRPRIVKLHGSLPSDGPFIITDEDYRRYPHEFAPFVNAVRQSLLENTLCLIGFSGDDPNFLQWVGWIHDNLGRRNSPKMYLLGLLDLSPSQETLLERRNITPVDMSLCSDIGGDHYRALEQIIGYLRSRRAADNRLNWPDAEHHGAALDDTNDPGRIVDRWKAQRHQYPGWVILPEDLRVSLWLETRRLLQQLSADLPARLDLDFAFELAWRLEKCLCPIFDDQAQLIESTIDRYWPTTGARAPLSSISHGGQDVHTRGLTLDDIRRRCHYLLLAMMRYYREEGLSEKWNEAGSRIQAVLASLSPELTAQFYYERALFALFSLNLQQVKSRLAEWPDNHALPFWSARKAGLLAEIGEVSDAQRLLEQSLESIRTKLNLTPTESDYTLVSQESLVMYLLHAIRQRSLFETSSQPEIQRQRRNFRERWHVLKQYKCDPWQEIESFERHMQRPPAKTSEVTRTPTFDIGRTVQTHHMVHWNKEALAAYNFLRFAEDAGLPFRLPGLAIATTSAAGTLTRIANYSSYWALTTLVRIGDAKVVDEIFDRPSLARMETPIVDALIHRYLDSLRSAVPDIASGDRFRAPNFGTLLAGVLPEILSRLCIKSSRETRERVLEWLLEVYRSDHRSNYQQVGILVRRLLESSSVGERVAMISKLLEFPILTDLDQLEQREYPNPFVFFNPPKDLMVKSAAIRPASLEVFFSRLSSDSPAARKWAASTLGGLHDVGLLDPPELQRFADGLWSQVDSDGLPADTNYYRFAFLSLPHPTGIEPVAPFKKYVRRARFPAQESETSTTIGLGGDHPLWRDICEARDVEWSTKDLHSILSRLVQWWDADKAHWRRAQVDKSFPSMVSALAKQLSHLVRTLAVMVARHPDSVNDERIRSSITRVAKECSQYEVPALQLEVACAYGLTSPRGPVLRQVDDAMTSSRTDAVIDALEAMDMISYHWASEADSADLMHLLCAASEMVRWRHGTALWATLGAVGDVVKRHPWTFVDDIERHVLTGLGRLAIESSLDEDSDTGVDVQGGLEDLSTKLIVRRSAARLAYRLYEHYRARGNAIPETIDAWEEVCRSDNEFLDIRNEWLVPLDSSTPAQ